MLKQVRIPEHVINLLFQEKELALSALSTASTAKKIEKARLKFDVYNLNNAFNLRILSCTITTQKKLKVKTTYYGLKWNLCPVFQRL